MSEKEHIQLNLSVHQLVDFLLRKGDIDNRIFNRTSMSEGSKIHSYYQSRQYILLVCFEEYQNLLNYE